ncbi:hypothetical protein B0T19DRAFT_84117 [Cercophora scortea]|uniref:Copper acquisition factor BIM1-like domain-containing protein n=1 Tax=Cercophora scortea TaxID=314031 RepID=A0AAE0MGF3_9PEZI|nr:hypothetical protein B0T19DRAFT_84117 [Cercophora scortea]
MAPLRSLVTATLMFLSAANAHFLLLNPQSLEGQDVDEDKEGNGPCGAITPDLAKDNGTNFYVDGDFVSVQLSHPQANWLIRGTVDSVATGNWSELFPEVKQSGLGKFCEPIVTAPASWVGKKGVISVVADAPDGLLFQCAVVNFVSGKNTPASGACTNASSVTGSFLTSADPAFATLVGTAASVPSSTASSTPSASATHNAAPALVQGGLPLGSMLVTAAMVLAGTALL